jgi:hypothetical protein
MQYQHYVVHLLITTIGFFPSERALERTYLVCAIAPSAVSMLPADVRKPRYSKLCGIPKNKIVPTGIHYETNAIHKRKDAIDFPSKIGMTWSVDDVYCGILVVTSRDLRTVI